MNSRFVAGRLTQTVERTATALRAVPPLTAKRLGVERYQ